MSGHSISLGITTHRSQVLTPGYRSGNIQDYQVNPGHYVPVCKRVSLSVKGFNP